MTTEDFTNVLSGGGEMGALMRTVDWSKTAVGPVSDWPQSLRTALSILLETGFPMYIAWGPDFTQFYNDGYRPILGSTKHPEAMGASTRETFAEIWNIIGPMFAGVMEGTATTVVDFLLPLERYGFIEECYFIFSYSPIRRERGAVGGVLVTVTETTQRVIGERRLKTSQQLAARTRDALTVTAACEIATAVLSENGPDLPFTLIYLIAPDGEHAVLVGASGAAPRGAGAPAAIDLEQGDPIWPLVEVIQSREPRVVDLPTDPVRDAVTNPPPASKAMVLPIVHHGAERAVGILVAALSPRLLLDDGYRDFLMLIASQIATAVATARALEEAQARADALAELDRAKTTFFNNISHEFRTPLTLLLGPTEEALASQDRTLRGDDLETVHRNGQRLLKLVNTLLDFSRVEAGRLQATFEPTDVAALTTGLASAFRSAIERAGLQLVVDCPPMPDPLYVDREMWEKIVLNLLSNAFKFTFAGTIAVTLSWRGSDVALSVRDTGVGIAPQDLDRIFDRFHRVERSRARTHEGSGIGLALVRELVTMQGGAIRVESTVGTGTTFTVSMPTGAAHVPSDRMHAGSAARSTDSRATVFVQEALRWLPAAAAPIPASRPLPKTLTGRVLIADDNADMREYIGRLLGEQLAVDTAADGLEALEAARRQQPDVIVADVMMPRMDGFALLRALRDDEHLRTVPVVLLSARAGEEARIDGLRAGADDYLVKPFTARELVARVQSQLVRARIRSVEEAHALRLTSIFEHAPVGVAILRGPDHVFEFANRAYLEMVGSRDVIGASLRVALPEVSGQGLFELLDHVFASGEPFIGRSVKVMLDRGGSAPEEAFFDFAYQPLRESDGVTGIAVVCFEVTELAKARRAAEAANRTKDDFLAMLGHELRNPLAPILTALQLMRLRGVTGAERERTVIERQVKHVVGLVDDLLDVSRITRGKVHLNRVRVVVADLVAKAVEMTSPAVEERRHTLHVEVPRGLCVEGDATRLGQVFANLLANAAKYTDPGGHIRVVAVEEGGEAVVSVADNGSGVSADMLPHIFDLFTQDRQAMDRSKGGLGLGLAIVRSLVQAHGGSVSVSSAGHGAGATFTVRLPTAGIAAMSPPEPEPIVQTSVPGRRVLIVDDNRDAADLLADALRALGHIVRVATDAPSALDVARAFRPDVALLDLGLPVMDGFELADRLRADAPGVALQLIAVTGYGQAGDRSRTRAAGFADHLVKPVDVRQIDRLIRPNSDEYGNQAEWSVG
jgi:signal transduction histidine kinase/DNA-binding response OmpR family regulator